jgi:hypothetical protein
MTSRIERYNFKQNAKRIGKKYLLPAAATAAALGTAYLFRNEIGDAGSSLINAAGNFLDKPQFIPLEGDWESVAPTADYFSGLSNLRSRGNYGSGLGRDSWKFVKKHREIAIPLATFALGSALNYPVIGRGISRKTIRNTALGAAALTTIALATLYGADALEEFAEAQLFNALK